MKYTIWAIQGIAYGSEELYEKRPNIGKTPHHIPIAIGTMQGLNQTNSNMKLFTAP